MPGPFNLESTVNVIKRGGGTLIISTGTNNNDDFHGAATPLSKTARLVVKANAPGGGDGELKGSPGRFQRHHYPQPRHARCVGLR